MGFSNVVAFTVLFSIILRRVQCYGEVDYTGQWSEMRPTGLKPEVRYAHSLTSMTLDDDVVLIVSHGYNNKNKPDWRFDTWLYSTNYNIWTELVFQDSDVRPSARCGHIAVTTGHDMYLFGGDDGGLSLKHNLRGKRYVSGAFVGDLWRLTAVKPSLSQQATSEPGARTVLGDHVWLWQWEMLHVSNQYPLSGDEALAAPCPRSLHTGTLIPSLGEGGAVSQNEVVIIIFGGLTTTRGPGSSLRDLNDVWQLTVQDKVGTDKIWKWKLVQPNTPQGEASVMMPAVPVGRHGHSAVAHSGSMYVFGGYAALSACSGRSEVNLGEKQAHAMCGSLADLWRLEILPTGVLWQRLDHPNAVASAMASGAGARPSRRQHHSTALVSLGGGVTDSSLPDGSEQPAAAATARAGMLVFGGGECDPGCTCLGDLWLRPLLHHAGAAPESERVAWQEVSSLTATTPPARYRHKAVAVRLPGGGVGADSSDVMFVFGGESYQPSIYYNDLWRWTPPRNEVADGKLPEAVAAASQEAQQPSNWEAARVVQGPDASLYPSHITHVGVVFLSVAALFLVYCRRVRSFHKRR